MTKLIKGVIALACAVPLAACGTLSGDNGAETAAKVLGNLEHCERQYTAVVGALGVPGGSLNIRCPAKPFDAP